MPSADITFAEYRTGLKCLYRWLIVLSKSSLMIQWSDALRLRESSSRQGNCKRCHCLLLDNEVSMRIKKMNCCCCCGHCVALSENNVWTGNKCSPLIAVWLRYRLHTISPDCVDCGACMPTTDLMKSRRRVLIENPQTLDSSCRSSRKFSPVNHQ